MKIHGKVEHAFQIRLDAQKFCGVFCNINVIHCTLLPISAGGIPISNE